MILFKKSSDLHEWLESQRTKGYKTGFVPTMGALHPAHISLLDASIKNNGITVCSIFVNPAQFNDPKDFAKYPVTIENDIFLLEKNGCNALFLPTVEEIYPDGIPEKPDYNLGYLETILEGKFRPGHFQGVCMVVHRLLSIVNPDNLYLGQKDYQQCMVIKKLVEIIGMHEKLSVNICPTLREDDGLAMSSRNVRLSEKEREIAVTLSQCLKSIREGIRTDNIEVLLKNAHTTLIKAGFKPDYIEIADAKTLEAIRDWNGKQKIVVIAAAYLNEVRLIDNLLIN